MSSRVRRMALGLATLTLVTSLFLAVQGFLDPPEQALAACEPMSGCYDNSFTVESPYCCCSRHRFSVWVCHTCWEITLSCDVYYHTECFDFYCAGSFCGCY